jgi:hypothetical protein
MVLHVFNFRIQFAASVTCYGIYSYYTLSTQTEQSARNKQDMTNKGNNACAIQ